MGKDWAATGEAGAGSGVAITGVAASTGSGFNDPGVYARVVVFALANRVSAFTAWVPADPSADCRFAVAESADFETTAGVLVFAGPETENNSGNCRISAAAAMNIKPPLRQSVPRRPNRTAREGE